MRRYSLNVEFVLRRSPYLINTYGIGDRVKAIRPSNVFPHPYPSLAYILGPAMGNRAATTERRTVLAAMAEAAYTV